MEAKSIIDSNIRKIDYTSKKIVYIENYIYLFAFLGSCRASSASATGDMAFRNSIDVGAGAGAGTGNDIIVSSGACTWVGGEVGGAGFDDVGTLTEEGSKAGDGESIKVVRLMLMNLEKKFSPASSISSKAEVSFAKPSSSLTW